MEHRVFKNRHLLFWILDDDDDDEEEEEDDDGNLKSKAAPQHRHENDGCLTA